MIFVFSQIYVFFKTVSRLCSSMTLVSMLIKVVPILFTFEWFACNLYCRSLYLMQWYTILLLSKTYHVAYVYIKCRRTSLWNVSIRNEPCNLKKVRYCLITSSQYSSASASSCCWTIYNFVVISSANTIRLIAPKEYCKRTLTLVYQHR